VWRVAGSVWLVILTSRVCDIFAVNIEGVWKYLFVQGYRLLLLRILNHYSGHELSYFLLVLVFVDVE
jgi:hypothetical protein